jgi:hypothetical protein
MHGGLRWQRCAAAIALCRLRLTGLAFGYRPFLPRPALRSCLAAAESFTQITYEPGKFSYHDNERLLGWH